MKLIEADPLDVVRNIKNHSHYRFEGPEKARARISPLELFPNGLLIPKPTPTIIDPMIEVHMVGPWHDDMTVEGKPDHSRTKYEAELAAKRAQLAELQDEYDLLPQNGTGKQSRGSWANKIKAVTGRIAMLEAGLAELAPHQVEHTQIEGAIVEFPPRSLVQLPSGRPGLVGSVVDGYADVHCRYQGVPMQVGLPVEVLRPWAYARVATV